MKGERDGTKLYVRYVASNMGKYYSRVIFPQIYAHLIILKTKKQT